MRLVASITRISIVATLGAAFELVAAMSALDWFALTSYRNVSEVCT